jgi:hypothetical protein
VVRVAVNAGVALPGESEAIPSKSRVSPPMRPLVRVRSREGKSEICSTSEIWRPRVIRIQHQQGPSLRSWVSVLAVKILAQFWAFAGREYLDRLYIGKSRSGARAPSGWR